MLYNLTQRVVAKHIPTCSLGAKILHVLKLSKERREPESLGKSFRFHPELKVDENPPPIVLESKSLLHNTYKSIQDQLVTSKPKKSTQSLSLLYLNFMNRILTDLSIFTLNIPHIII